MINDETVDHYNTRLTVDLGNLKNLTAAQADRVRQYGSQAEALLKNRDLAMFIHHFKFSQCDSLASIRGYSPDDNSQRIAISNELAGIDNFVTSLRRAVYLKNRIGNTDHVPNDNT